MRRRFERVKLVVEVSKQLADWEMEEWRGGSSFADQHGALIDQTTSALMAPY